MRRILAVSAMILLLICLTACGPGNTVSGSQEETEEMNTAENGSEDTAETTSYDREDLSDVEINCWGDSMTEGYGSDGLTYPDVLGQLTGMTVRNLGVGGEDSREILKRSIAFGSQKEDILVIQMGDNGGWRDIDELIRQYQKLIKKAGTDRYIIISSTDDSDDPEQIWSSITDPAGSQTTTYEEKLVEAFGDHVFNGRLYLVEHGLEINGLEETAEDRARAREGNISLQLRNPEEDNTHVNEAGYIAMAHGVYEKGKELGYW